MEYFLLLAPAVFSLSIFAAMAISIWARDRVAPLADAGVIAGGISALYISLPAIFFALAGFEWTMASDRRLYLLQVTPEEMGAFLWRPAVYLSAFCLVYMLVRPVGGVVVEKRINAPLGFAILATIFGTTVWRVYIETRYGVSILQSNIAATSGSWIDGLPLLVVQVTQHTFGIENIAKLAGAIWLISAARFHRSAWIALLGWLAFEAYATLTLLGPRTYFATLILGCILAIHLFIRPMGVRALMVVLPTALIALLSYGYLRDGSFDFTQANEFQILLGTPMQLRDRMTAGDITVPLGLRLHELLQFIPQQLIPIEKFDPNDWYVEASGVDARGSGFMFGVVSQSIVGWGWVELFLRGAALAAVLALFYRLYRWKPTLLWTIAYIWLCTTIYYSYRASTFYWLSFVAYRLLPFLALVGTLSWLMEFGGRRISKAKS